MQVIGLCRFSYPAIGGFQVEHGSIEERMAYLYAPERMEERFRTFETMTLPSMRAQTDPDFIFLIVTGDSLPLPYLERLANLVEDMPQAVIQQYGPGRHRQIMQKAINSVRAFDGRPCLQFRMDDDDAVAVSFVARLREVAREVQLFSRHHRHVAIDFSTGFVARPGPKGIDAAPNTQRFTTAGLGILFQDSIRLSIMNFSHNKVDLNMPTVTIPDANMMVRGHNDFNDSRQGKRVKPVPLSPLDREGEALFRTAFNIDADHVRQVYQGVG